MTLVSVSVHTNQHVNLHTNSIPTRALVTAGPNHVLPLTTLSVNPVAASVVITTLAPSTAPSTEGLVGASVLKWKSVDLHNDSTRISVNVSAPATDPVWPIRFSTATGAGVNVSRATNTNAGHTMCLTTTVVTAYVTVVVPHRMS